MRKFYLLSTLVLVILLGSTSYAQDYSNKGKDFWISYPEHINGTGSIMGLYLTSDLNTTGQINDNGTLIPFTVTANTITIVFLGTGGGFAGPNSYIHLGGIQDGIKTNAAVHITAALPIVVFAHIINSARSGSTLALPTNVWGKEYIVPSYANSGGNGLNQGYGEINVMASLPNTQIEITPSIITRNGARAAGVPYTITLTNPGDVYQIQFPQNLDLSGTIIKSVANGGTGCQPIAVITASTWSAINCGSGNGGDNFYQQLFPSSAWGKQFFTTPLKKTASATDHNTDIIRVFVKDPTTKVKKTENGLTTVLVGLSAQGFYEYQTEFPTYIDADRPVEVFEYIKTQNCNTAGSPQTQSDPELIALSSVEQTINDITVYSANNSAVPGGNSNVNVHYINVVMRSANTGTFTINGVSPPAASWISISGTVYSYLKQSINAAITPVSRLKADSAFNAYAYGFGNVESYGYNAGTNVKDIQGLILENLLGNENSSICTFTPFHFKFYYPDSTLGSPGIPPVEIRFDQISWTLTNTAIIVPNNFPVVQANPPIDSTNLQNGRQVNWYSIPGSYFFSSSGLDTVRLTVSASTNDGCGAQQTFEFPIQISDPPTGSFTWTTNGCVTQPVPFTETTPQVPKTTYRFWWEFGDPASGPLNNSTVRNPTHLFTAPGTYTVRYAAITTPGCLTDTISQQITLTDPPVAGFTPSPSPYCVGVPIVFTDNSTASGGAIIINWRWDFGDGTIINAPNGNPQAHSYVLPGPYTVSLLVTTSTGCMSIAYNFPLIVQSNATITLTSAPGTDNQTKCVNSQITDITYQIGGSGTGGTVTGLPPGVTWVFAGGVLTISGTPTLNGTYNYTVSTLGPCIKPDAPGTITVNPLPTATINGTTAVCVNAPSPNVTFTGASGTAPYTFTYNINGGPNQIIVSAGNIATIPVSTIIAGTFTYNIVSVQDASSTLCNQPQSGSATITVNPLPTASINGTTTVCLNAPLPTITFTGAGATAPYTFTYNINGGPNLIAVSIGNTAAITAPTNIAGIFIYNLISVQDASSTTCSQAQTGSATVIVNPLPTATINGTTTLCLNAPSPMITFTGAGATAPYTFTYNINGGPNQIIISVGNTATIAVPTNVAGTFTYNLISVQDASSTTCSQAQSGSATVIVHPLPTPNFTFTMPSCETRVITFADASIPNAAGLISWAWNFGDGPGTDPNQNPTHTYATAGTYNVTLSVTNSNGCISNPVANIPVTINIRPKSGFIVPQVCINDIAAVFTDTSSIAAPGTFNPLGYQWDFGDGSPLTFTQNGTHLYLATGVYQVTHIVTSSLGCKDTLTQPITINGANPVADFNVINPATLCSNDSVGVRNLSTVNFGNVTRLEIYWDFVGTPGVFQTINNPVFNAIYKHKYPTLQTTQNYSIRMISYSGNICFTNKTVIATVNAAPLVQFNPMPNICYDAIPYQITPAIASETGGVPGNGIFTGPGVTLTGLFSPAVAGPGVHRILYTFTSTAGGCVDTASNTIRVWDTASAKINVQPLACERSNVSFDGTNSNTPPGNGNINGYIWNFGDPASGALNTSAFPAPTHLFTGWGSYNVTLFVTTDNGCRSTNRSLTVNVNPIARPNFTFTDTACLPSANVAFNNLSTIPDGTENSFMYNWNFGDPGSGINNTASIKNPSHIYNNVGNYPVTLQVTAGNGCVHDTLIIVKSIHPQPTALFNTDKVDVCIGGGIQFTDNSNPADGAPIIQWVWDLANGTTNATPSFNYIYPNTGIYNVTLYIYNSYKCKSTTFTIPVSINPYPPINAGPDKFMLEGGQVTLTPALNASMPVTYLWTPNFHLSNPNIAYTIASPPFDYTYTLTMTTDKGCAKSDDVFIKVLKAPAIPNIFSPNGDGIHDTWVIQYLESYPGCTVDIFNRYGQKIFHSEGYSKPWDGTVNGKPVPIGTYYYIVNPKNGRSIMSGYVDVIR